LAARVLKENVGAVGAGSDRVPSRPGIGDRAPADQGVVLFISHTDTAPVFLFCSRMSAKAILIENRRLRSPAMPFQDWG
jgi:hypothetical protein